MYANSRPIFSAQTGPHADLLRMLDRHATSTFRAPISGPSTAAYRQAMDDWTHDGGARPLIIDAGCGVGWSTIRLATLFPEHWVIGVDKSEDRLLRDKTADPVFGGKSPLPANARLVRADLVDFWRLLVADGVQLARHYLLYPNPWPKIGHLARRWHGHAVFPEILRLGGILECRSNWGIYVEELALAVNHLTGRPVVSGEYRADDPWTPFERKYRDSGQILHRCQADLTP